MAGKPNGKMFKTMVAKHGSEEAARAWFRTVGAKGGRAGMGPDYEGGFASHTRHFCPVLPGEHKISQCAGTKGGQVSKHGKKQ